MTATATTFTTEATFTETVTFTKIVTYTRGVLLFERDEVSVYIVEADYGSARGLIWVEDRFGSDDPAPEVMESGRFRERFPYAERRQQTQTSAVIADAHPALDRRAA